MSTHFLTLADLALTLQMIASGLAGASFGVLLLWSVRRGMRMELRRELNGGGSSVCLRCGYDLRGQIEPRCSECGTRGPADRHVSGV